MTRSHRYRRDEDAELDRFINAGTFSPESVREQGGRNRIVDLWLVWECASALRTVYRGRYASPRIRRLILEARAALDALAEALRQEGRG
jgi:hypothetical protein